MGFLVSVVVCVEYCKWLINTTPTFVCDEADAATAATTTVAAMMEPAQVG